METSDIKIGKAFFISPAALVWYNLEESARISLSKDNHSHSKLVSERACHISKTLTGGFVSTISVFRAVFLSDAAAEIVAC